MLWLRGEGRVVTCLVFDDLLPHLESLSMKADFLGLFSRLNFAANSARFDNDLFPQVTVLDLTLNGLLESFLAGEWEGDPYQQYRGIESHHTVSDSDLCKLYHRVMGKRVLRPHERKRTIPLNILFSYHSSHQHMIIHSYAHLEFKKETNPPSRDNSALFLYPPL